MEPTDTQARCELHPDARVAGTCLTCGKPICSICVQLNGHFCSDLCAHQHTHGADAIVPDGGPSLHDAELDKAGKRAEVISKWLFKRIPLAVLVIGGLLFALKMADKSGSESWKLVASGSARFVSVIPSGDTVFGVRSDGVCLALDANTGEEKWSAKVSESESGGFGFSFLGFSSLFSGAGLFITNDVLVHKGWSSIKIINPDDGAELWQRKLSGWGATPTAFGGGRMLTVDSGRSQSSVLSTTPAVSSLLCLDLKTGKPQWKRSYGSRNVLMVGINDKLCYCVSCVPASSRWVRCEKHKTAQPMEMYYCDKCKMVWTPPSRYAVNVMKTKDGKPVWTGQMKSGEVAQVKLLADRLVLVTSHHLYIVGINGDKHAIERLPAKLQQTFITSDHVVISTQDSNVFAYSTDDGERLWSQQIKGWTWDLQVAGQSVYVTAGIPEEKKAKDKKQPDGTPRSPTARTPQQKMMEEMGSSYEGYAQEQREAMRPSARTLIRYDLPTGKERLRKKGFIGHLVVHSKGFMSLQQGSEAAGRFIDGTGSVLASHLNRNGKPCWEYKINEQTHAVAMGGDKVYIITAPGSGVLGQWSTKAEPGSKLRAINRRKFINYVRKF